MLRNIFPLSPQFSTVMTTKDIDIAYMNQLINSLLFLLLTAGVSGGVVLAVP
jgi:hypothetical protein